MKTFIAYRHTGEKTEFLQELLTKVSEAFSAQGIEAYATFFDEESFKDKSLGAADIMEHAFSIIAKSDFLFVVLASENKSEGMLMEVGFCKAKSIPIVVAAKEQLAGSYLPDMADLKLVWSDIDDLATKISQADFSKL